MPRLPNRFDLWVRHARSSTDPARQIDWILGALVALKDVHFLNSGTKASPVIARATIGNDECALVFTDSDRVEEFIAGHPALQRAPEEGPPVIASPSGAALTWCVENRAGLVINPGDDDTALVPCSQIAPFVEEWQRRQDQPAGFWIPNLTTEEEDFWREHGL
jgi:hypothetical protein